MIDSYPASDDDTSNNRNESDISKPSLPLQRHQIGKHGCEKRRRSANGLIERDRQISKRNVSANDRGTKDHTEARDLDELDSGSNSLHWHHLHPRNCDVAEQRTSRHVTHCEEDRVLESIVA